VAVSNSGVEQAFRPALRAITTLALAAEVKLLTFTAVAKAGHGRRQTAGLKACSTLAQDTTTLELH
jgi:hypothetical protein